MTRLPRFVAFMDAMEFARARLGVEADGAEDEAGILNRTQRQGNRCQDFEERPTARNPALQNAAKKHFNPTESQAKSPTLSAPCGRLYQRNAAR